MHNKEVIHIANQKIFCEISFCLVVLLIIYLYSSLISVGITTVIVIKGGSYFYGNIFTEIQTQGDKCFSFFCNFVNFWCCLKPRKINLCTHPQAHPLLQNPYQKGKLKTNNV